MCASSEGKSMRNKPFKVFAVFLLLTVMLTGLFCPVSVSARTSEAQEIISEIRKYNGAESMQSWIDTSLTSGAGVSSEWYVIGLSQYGNYDFSAYGKALEDHLESNVAGSASSRLKYAVVLASIGSGSSYISDALSDAVGQQGIMSYVYGLHLLNNGYKSPSFTLEEVKSAILSMQTSDGGWSVRGTAGEVDVTAMVVQSLAPLYNADPKVKTAVDKALELLSESQMPSGGFVSYGVENAESSAQVLVALSALGIDAESDGRFIKNSNNIFDAMASFRLPDGSYCHKAEGSSNATATSQVFYAMVAYVRMTEGRSPLYILDRSDSSALESTEASATADTVPTQDGENTKISYKVWVVCGIILVACGFTAAIIIGKKNKRNLIFVAVIAAALVALVLVTDFKSADEYYSETAEKSAPAGTVTISISCDNIPDKSADHIPDDGVILSSAEYVIEEGDTVRDILLEATKEHKIHLETQGVGASVYIEGIGNIYEFDYGELSGWTYLVNGQSPSVSSGEYILSDGDVVLWAYTCNAGEDIGE